MQEEKIVYLGDYPLQECWQMCVSYAHSQIDWNAVKRTVSDKEVAVFDVSDAVELFPHLELDERYNLICYVSKEHHGLWGHTAAIKRGDSSVPQKAESAMERKLGVFHLPETAVFPMDVIYNDGTSEGFLEAVLFQQMIRALPCIHFEWDVWNRIVGTYPNNFPADWDVYAEIRDWTPRAIWDSSGNCKIMVCHIEIENGFGASDGRSRLYLTKCSFKTGLKFHYWSEQNNSRITNIYKGRVEDDSRYGEKRRCCVYNQSSVLIAKVSREKAGDWGIWDYLM